MNNSALVKTARWNKIVCSFRELNLDIVLAAGQSFRWRKKEDVWQGVLAQHLFALKQDIDGNLLYIVRNGPEGVASSGKTRRKGKPKSSATENAAEILKDFFQLDVNLEKLYLQWSSADSNFEALANRFQGVRILRQDPTENLISFICSANNNIPRISSMVEKLCSKYGKEIFDDGTEQFYSFPALSALSASSVESDLRSMGFGYRAKYINQSAKHIINNHPPGWLESLRRLPYEEAHSALIALPGVGAKVADCVCLMSLDKPGAIPVDTHVWQITVKDYLPQLKTTKSLTDKIYHQIGNFYRDRFGAYAGWANTVLFAADLKQFKKQAASAKD